MRNWNAFSFLIIEDSSKRLDTTYEELKSSLHHLSFHQFLRLDTTYEELKFPLPLVSMQQKLD